MNHFELELRWGESRRVIPAFALAAALRLPPRELHRALELLLHPERLEQPNSNTESTGRGKGDGSRFDSIDPIDQENMNSESIRSESIGSDARAEDASDDGRSPSLAHDVAAALDDLANLGAFETLTRSYPPQAIHEALRRTLEIPAERIRTRRAAYFTKVLRNLAGTHAHADGT